MEVLFDNDSEWKECSTFYLNGGFGDSVTSPPFKKKQQQFIQTFNKTKSSRW